MKDARQKLLDMNINGTVVSVIIERERDGGLEVLVQTRCKPERDAVYSGTLEIPAGGVASYENVYAAARREVWEETGLRVTRFYPDVQTPIYGPQADDCFAFVCRVEEAEPVPGPGEVG